MSRTGLVSAIAAAANTLAVALASVGTALDLALLLIRHAGAATEAATVGVEVSLAVFAGALAAPALALVACGMRRTRGRGWELAWPASDFAAGTAIALLLTDALYRPHTTPYVILAAWYGGVLAALT